MAVDCIVQDFPKGWWKFIERKIWLKSLYVFGTIFKSVLGSKDHD